MAAMPRDEKFESKAIEPRIIEPRTKVDAKDFWKRMDDLFDRSMSIAEQSYRTNRNINLVIVGVGIVLLANSIAYTWYKQSADAWSIFSGAIGIASFVALFFLGPQKQVTKGLGNLAQIQMVYKSHSLEFESISDYDWERFKRGGRDINEIAQMNRELEKATANAVKMIQKYIEEDQNEENDVEEDNKSASPAK